MLGTIAEASDKYCLKDGAPSWLFPKHANPELTISYHCFSVLDQHRPCGGNFILPLGVVIG